MPELTADEWAHLGGDLLQVVSHVLADAALLGNPGTDEPWSIQGEWDSHGIELEIRSV